LYGCGIRSSDLKEELSFNVSEKKVLRKSGTNREAEVLQIAALLPVNQQNFVINK
jgi:hypothetical protein